MLYITSIERIGRAEGRVEGRVEGRLEGLRASILSVAKARWGEAAGAWAERLGELNDLARLDALLGRVATAETLADVEL